MTTGVKIGIDVGGTFTHAVAIDTQTHRLLGKVRVPTTHRADLGVAAGVVQALQALIQTTGLAPDQIQLIAHSTTQATNALLEGDVAKVGIIALSHRWLRWVTQMHTRLQDIELAPGQFLPTCHGWLGTDGGISWPALAQLVAGLKAEGAEVFAVSSAFAVDDPEPEQQVVTWLRQQGYLATAGSELSQLYGLRLRTRTAVINAALLPRMLATAQATEQAVRAAGITAPVMVMRSDGGLMSLADMRQRPLLTILSGPAAGVAAALSYACVSDGVFLDVGGTSTDISAIVGGRPQLKTAEIAGKRLYLRSLDIRTVGVAGGSVPCLRGQQVVDVGPRSAHIAGLQYISFSDTPVQPEQLQRQTFAPQRYLAIANQGQPTWTLTPTDAALVLQGRESPSPYAKTLLSWLAAELGTTPLALAERVLQLASRKIQRAIERLLADYNLNRHTVTLIGGGGAAAALVPYVAQRMGLRYWLAPDAEVIAAIGVALGLLQETLERSVVDPTPADIQQLRQAVVQSVLRMGAHPATVQVRVQVDQRQQKITATATGALELRTPSAATTWDPQQAQHQAAQALGCRPTQVQAIAQLGPYGLYQKKGRSPYRPLVVLRTNGIVHLRLPSALVYPATVATLLQQLTAWLQAHKTYGDGGELYPALWVVLPERLVDCSGLLTPDQVLAFLSLELANDPPEQPALALVAPRH